MKKQFEKVIFVALICILLFLGAAFIATQLSNIGKLLILLTN